MTSLHKNLSTNTANKGLIYNKYTSPHISGSANVEPINKGV